MSYLVIPVYSFACDHQRPGDECPQLFECSPANGGYPRLLDEAHSQLRAQGWEVRGRGETRRHFCPQHRDGQE